MKRSKINSAIEWAISLLDKNNFKLPQFAYWDLETWKKNRDKTEVIQHVMQGWDVTDYEKGRFDEVGGVLYTIRNGDIMDPKIGTPYAEKLILLLDGQALPVHYHASKTEDIINRGGGILALKFYNTTADKTVDYETDVTVYTDGIRNTFKAGETVLVTPGNSVTITPYINHMFWAYEGKGDLIIGEVSSINDDKTDNYFAEEIARFSTIIEDEAIKYPLCNEYLKVLY
jgi:D-lyxose ketol-isomerase